MNFADPRHVVSLTADSKKFGFYVEMQRDIIKQALQHISQVYPFKPNINPRIVQEVHDYLKEILGIVASEVTIVAMFILYPTDASVIDDLSATDARDSLMDMISHYYVNSYWPGIDDGVDDEDWEDLIRRAHSHMRSTN